MNKRLRYSELPRRRTAKPEFEIRKDGSTIDRFAGLTRLLLRVSRDEVRKAEQAFKAEQQKRRATKRKT
jgi:hypothetical protein